MDPNMQVWILTFATMGLIGIISFIAKLVTQQVVKRLDSIITELQALTRVTTTQEITIRSLQDNQAAQSAQMFEHSNQLNEHSHRIMRIELKVNEE
jgi:hypothetical protein